MPARYDAGATIRDRSIPNIFDAIALALILGLIVVVVSGSRGLNVPLPAADTTVISLDYSNLPYYALRTTLRMFAALAASIVFTLIYATLAAKSRRAEIVLIPILDVLQSVPILGFLSFTVTFFLGLFPGSTLGAECAAVFAIFTSQAWNMAFSFYQSLRTVPKDLIEVSRSFQLTGWQRFWWLEAPFAVPGLLWNTMMSMSGGWFFIVAAEAIAVGDTTIKLPGIGSYIAQATDEGRMDAVGLAVLTMFVVILAYDQLLFRPVVAFAGKFRVETSSAAVAEESWVLSIFQRTRWLRGLMRPVSIFTTKIAFWRLRLPLATRGLVASKDVTLSRLLDLVWYVAIAAATWWAGQEIYDFVAAKLTLSDFKEAVVLTLITMARVVILLMLASLIWVPVGVWIGLRPKVAERVQPIAQFLAAFPINTLFPIATMGILAFRLNPDIWLSLLIIFGTQWYILFNVIAGTSAFPNDLKEAAKNFHVKGSSWWRNVMLPGIFPYYVTGALTASGGSWNASIVAEYVKWKSDKVAAHGIGAYIAQATEAGDYGKIVLGVAIMSVFVILLNRLFWRPLFAYGERRLHIA